MSESIEFSADEFADYWDSLENDRQIGEDFMTAQLPSRAGRELLASTATVLANRHGVSSDKLKTFRTSMRKACLRLNMEDIYTPRKVKGTGTKKHPEVLMYIDISSKHTSPKIADSTQLVKGRMQRWINKGECTIEDLSNAVRDIELGL